MPSASVPTTDYLTTEIACRYSGCKRQVVASYFSIGVTTLNSRLRKIAEKLWRYPNAVKYALEMIKVAVRIRPELTDLVHPIWEISRRLLQSYLYHNVEAEIHDLRNARGPLYEYVVKSSFSKDGEVPTVQPPIEDANVPSERQSQAQPQPEYRKGPHGTDLIASPRVSPVTISGSASPASKSNSVELDQNHDLHTTDICKHSPATHTTEKVFGKGSRSEPYSIHELCIIYIARKIRQLDWDVISWSISRFKTPTVGMLAAARTKFETHHDSILDTIQLCCWPENSMYLVSYAANVCINALERGQWSQELASFRKEDGPLYHLYRQRMLERIHRKSTETPSERLDRRRRERMFGISGLSKKDFENLPTKKKVGAIQTPVNGELNKMRRGNAKKEIRALAEKKTAVKTIQRSDDHTGDQEAITSQEQIVRPDAVKQQSGTVLSRPRVDVTNGTPEATEVKKIKAIRRKYDIIETEKVTFTHYPKLFADRRRKYDVDDASDNMDEKLCSRMDSPERPIKRRDSRNSPTRSDSEARDQRWNTETVKDSRDYMARMHPKELEKHLAAQDSNSMPDQKALWHTSRCAMQKEARIRENKQLRLDESGDPQHVIQSNCDINSIAAAAQGEVMAKRSQNTMPKPVNDTLPPWNNFRNAEHHKGAKGSSITGSLEASASVPLHRTDARGTQTSHSQVTSTHGENAQHAKAVHRNSLSLAALLN